MSIREAVEERGVSQVVERLEEEILEAFGHGASLSLDRDGLATAGGETYHARAWNKKGLLCAEATGTSRDDAARELYRALEMGRGRELRSKTAERLRKLGMVST